MLATVEWGRNHYLHFICERKKHREVKELSQGHTAEERWSQKDASLNLTRGEGQGTFSRKAEMLKRPLPSLNTEYSVFSFSQRRKKRQGGGCPA